MSDPITHETAHVAVPPVSPAAVALIVANEISSPAYYRQALQSPTWPGESSGVTIGIGYDLGYVTRDQFAADWQAVAPAIVSGPLAAVCGLKGPRAQTALPALAHILVPLEAAEAVFRDATLPRYAAQTADAFPGCAALPPDAFGALVSLVFNRGPAMGSPSDPPPDRRREMRGIRDAIAAGNPRAVPQLLLDMRRLWPNAGGLRSRRAQEAALFAESLPKEG